MYYFSTREFTIKEPIVRFNRGKSPNQVRNAVVVIREIEGVDLRKKMMRCTANGLLTLAREGPKSDFDFLARRQKIHVALDTQITLITYIGGGDEESTPVVRAISCS
jgi:hypothetical protein